MRRLCLILMLLVLPLQVSWAAVSSYCKHESGTASQHFGHHNHQHKTKAAEKAPADASIQIDTDCAFCFGSAFGLITLLVTYASANVPKVEPVFADTNFLASIRPDRPERPKWMRAV